MPVARFFLMLKHARMLIAEERSELCDIQAISICSSDYYKVVKAKYTATMRADVEAIPEPPAPPPNVVQAESSSAQYAIMGMIGSLKGGI